MFCRFTATAVFVAVLYLGGTGSGNAAQPLSGSFMPTYPPRDVPDFVIKNDRGKSVTLHEVLKQELSRGGYVLLNIWATWCVPCVGEMPSLNRLQSQMAGRGLSIITLAQDREGAYSVPAFFRRKGLGDLKAFLDPEGLSVRRFNLRGIPTTLLIDPAGKEVGRIKSNVDWVREDNLVFLSQLIGGTRTF